MYFVYILQSLKDLRYYIGYAEDVAQRLERHNNGSVKATKNRRPLTVIYKKGFETRIEATRYERLIKSYHGGEGFKKLIHES